MDAARLHVRLLGPFEVLVDGRPVGPAGERRRGLLALLALEANTVVPVEALVDRMWGESPPASALNVVQTYVSAWRKVLDADGRTSPSGRRLQTVGAGYRLGLTTDECDVLLFRDDLARARAAVDRTDHGTAAVSYAQALGRWRGPTLADLSRQPFHDALTRELAAARLSAVEGWAAALRSGPAATPPRWPAALTEESQPAEPLRESLAELAHVGPRRVRVGRPRHSRSTAGCGDRLRVRAPSARIPGRRSPAMHDRVLAIRRVPAARPARPPRS